MTTVGFAAEQAEFTTNSLPVPDHGSICFKAPKGWSFLKKGAVNPFGPRSAEFRSEDGLISAQATFFWDGFGPKQMKPSEKDLADLTEKSGKAQFLSGSVEKKVVLENFKGAEASGCFARFTDADWVGKKPPAGEFANVTTGMVRCGDLWGNFTILTNEKDGPSFKQALVVIETLQKAKP